MHVYCFDRDRSLVLVATLLMLVSGIPVAFGLGAISILSCLSWGHLRQSRRPGVSCSGAKLS